VTASNILAGAAIAFFVSAALSIALARSKWSFWPRDTPNERSLHATPTPRTGGLAILFGLSAALLVTQGLPAGPAIWICAATGLLAVVSFADDRMGLPVGVRFIAHTLAAGAAVWGAGLAAARVWLPFVGEVSLGAFAAPLSFLGILWLTNLYNFMDGMDGFAGAMTVIGGACLGLASWRGGDGDGALVSSLLSASAAGFLLKNWPPARIFLGDVGSIPIGFLVSVLALRASAMGALDIGASCLVFAPFILDATITLVRRVLAGERVWSAHRSHYYQRLVLSGYSHVRAATWEAGLMAFFGSAALVYQAVPAARIGILAACITCCVSAVVAVRSAERRAGRRPRTLLIVSQVFVPDPAAVGQHLADVAFEMARRGFDVNVLTSACGYDDPTLRYPSRETIAGVRIHRLPLSSFGKSSILVRLAAQVFFAAQACAHGLFTAGLSSILVSTSPPFCGAVGVFLSVLRRVPLVYWVMDLNPDQTIAIGKLRPGSAIAHIFDALNRVTLARASRVIALDEFMATRLNAKRDVRRKLHVIPPWPIAVVPPPTPAAENPFRHRHGLADAFVVMYAGNHSPANPLQTLLEAVGRLANEPRIRFVFVGGGEGKKDVDAVVARGAKNILSLPYQPLADVGHVLAAADVHVVSIGDAMVGIIHPSKVYGAMAAGRPVLCFGPTPSHLSELVKKHGIGWHVAQGDVAGAEAILRRAASMAPGELRSIGNRACEEASRWFDASVLRSRLCDAIASACLATHE
jgi:UDP-N-acetylmuramyl pentapeptide phosphotransferase/UDP-N-acetylglucosamine-1-phosphate transferase